MRLNLIAIIVVLVAATLVPAESAADSGASQLAAESDVMVIRSCLGGGGRVDLNLTNSGAQSATYRVEFEGLTPREVTVDPADWGRVSITGRPAGSYLLEVQRAGQIAFSERIGVACADYRDVTLSGIQVVSSCRNDTGYLLVQVVNASEQPKPYVFEFPDVPNRSTTAAAWGQGVRAITGRPNGTYLLNVRSNGAKIAQRSVSVQCGDGPVPELTLAVDGGAAATTDASFPVEFVATGAPHGSTVRFVAESQVLAEVPASATSATLDLSSVPAGLAAVEATLLTPAGNSRARDSFSLGAFAPVDDAEPQVAVLGQDAEIGSGSHGTALTSDEYRESCAVLDPDFGIIDRGSIIMSITPETRFHNLYGYVWVPDGWTHRTSGVAIPMNRGLDIPNGTEEAQWFLYPGPDYRKIVPRGDPFPASVWSADDSYRSFGYGYKYPNGLGYRPGPGGGYFLIGLNNPRAISPFDLPDRTEPEGYNEATSVGLFMQVTVVPADGNEDAVWAPEPCKLFREIPWEKPTDDFTASLEFLVNGANEIVNNLPLISCIRIIDDITGGNARSEPLDVASCGSTLSANGIGGVRDIPQSVKATVQYGDEVASLTINASESAEFYDRVYPPE